MLCIQSTVWGGALPAQPLFKCLDGIVRPLSTGAIACEHCSQD